MTSRKQRNWRVLLAAVAVVASVGFALRSMLSGPDVSPSVDKPNLSANPAVRAAEKEARKEANRRRDAQLRSAPSITHAEIDRFRVLIDQYINPPPYEPERLTHEARAALVETLQRYASAWLADTPDEYMAIVQSEHTVWKPPGDKKWQIADEMLRYSGEPPTDPEDPAGSLRRLLEVRKFSADRRWVRMSYGESATLVLTDYARTVDELWENSQLTEGTMDDPRSRRCWYWVAGRGQRLREPSVAPVDIIREYRGVLTADTFLTFTDAESQPSIWCAKWYWDPTLGVWHNLMSACYGPYRNHSMFY